jgi:hypothetical protein
LNHGWSNDPGRVGDIVPSGQGDATGFRQTEKIRASEPDLASDRLRGRCDMTTTDDWNGSGNWTIDSGDWSDGGSVSLRATVIDRLGLVWV